MASTNSPKSPLLEIVAGPNGSGKSTFAESFIVKARKESTYLNPDLIASGFGPSDSEQASFQAGRILLGEVKDRIVRLENFAFESTLSGKTWLSLLKQAKSKGYTIRLYFLYLKNIGQNLERIKKRVQMGGHNIPRDTVKRRHPRCFENFWNLYRPLADDWHIFDNSEKSPREVLNLEAFTKLSPKSQANFAASFLKGKVKDL